jgi:SAM-dependent methyltransferase
MEDRGDLAQTAAFWDDITAQHFKDGVNTRREEWQTHPATIAHRRRLLGDRDTAAWLTDRLPARIDRALGAGCGTAGFELGLLASGAVAHFDLCDVSPTSLESAMAQADQRGLADRVTIHCGDLLAAERSGYGLVTFVNSLHHATDVAATVRFAHQVLSPGGLLFADEYIGPRRFGYPPAHADLMKALYRALAPELRCQWPELPQPDPADVAAADPTEAGESDLIVDTVRAQFEDVELAPIYGALPFILWWGLDHDALWDTPAGRDFAEFLLTLDSAMGSSGALPPYFSLILARRC